MKPAMRWEQEQQQQQQQQVQEDQEQMRTWVGFEVPDTRSMP
jgi:hypothetical protein